MRPATIRSTLEQALEQEFTLPEQSRPETVSTGIPEIDGRTGGGLPRGRITEVCGPDSTGRTTLALSSIAQITEKEEFCAFVDPAGTFDPASAESMGVDLGRLLWVRTKRRKDMDQTLKALDLLVQGGGFGLIATDLGEMPAADIRRVPLSIWFRLQRAAENTPTILLFIGRESHIQTCASLVLALRSESTDWSGGLFRGIHPRAQIVRSRTHPVPPGRDRSDVFPIRCACAGLFPNPCIEGVSCHES